MWKCDLVVIREGEPAVLCNKLMQMRGAAAPMTKNEKRRLENNILHQWFISTAFIHMPSAVLATVQGDTQEAKQTREIDR